MRSLLRSAAAVAGSSLLLGGDCMFGRPIIDDKGRYYPSDELISCEGTRCAELPTFELELPPPIESPCARDLPSADLATFAASQQSLVGMRYVLSSATPREVNLGVLAIRDACIVLSGPVRVTLAAGSELSGVAVLLGARELPELDGGQEAPAPGSDAGLFAEDAAQELTDSATPADSGVDRDAGSADGGAAEDGGALELSTAHWDEVAVKAAASVAGSGTPNLYLANASLNSVSLGPLEPGAPSGSAQIEFSVCTQCEVRLDALNVTESEVHASRLEAAKLNLVGGLLDTVELSFEYALLAGLSAKDLRTASCNKLSLVGCTITGRATQIGPCDCGLPPAVEADAGAELLDAGWAEGGLAVPDLPSGDDRDASAPEALPDATSCQGATLVHSSLYGGTVDGRVHAEHVTFQSVIFARHAPTSLDAWFGDIRLGVICEQPMTLRLDETAGVGCVSCDAPASTAVCSMYGEPQLIANTCKSLAGALSACSPPLPMPVSSPPLATDSSGLPR